MIGDKGDIPHELYKQVLRAARRAKVSWEGGDAGVGDIVSRVWIYLLESPNQLQKILDMAPDQQRQTLAWIAHRECAEEYEDFLEYCGSNLYNRDDVKDMLAKGILHKDVAGHYWLPRFIHQALDRMKMRDKVRDEHHRGVTDYAQVIHDRYGKNKQEVQKDKLNHALERLTIEVNRAVRRHDTEG